jgi:hypothetical protein
MTIILRSYLVFVALCLGLLTSCQPQQTGSQLSAAVVTTDVMVCRALWVCKGQTNPRGEITSKFEYPAEAYELCRADLEEQLQSIKWCPQGEELLAESVAATTSQVNRTILTTKHENGAALLKLLQKTKADLERGCSGDACYPYWQELIDSMNHFPAWAEYLKEKNLTISGEIAEAAYDLNVRICRVKHDGSQKWLDVLHEKSATAVAVARFIQLRYGVTAPIYCSFEYKKNN